MLELYRLACPKHKHRNLLYRQKGGYYCDSCREYYEKVVDLKTDRLVPNASEAH